jgi:hypothetical protein
MISEGKNPADTVFDIFRFNQYAWAKGYKDVLLDYYLNSPFCSTFVLPFTILQNAYTAKAVFNGISIILLVLALEILVKTFKANVLVSSFPLLFFIPIQNNILFGQFYFIIFASTVFAYYFYSKNQQSLASVFIVNAAFLKVFPLLFGVPLLKKIKYKILFFVGFCFGFSVLFNGFSFWEAYLFKFFPQNISNNTSIGFQANAQSLDVFFKHLFVADTFHNPNPFFDNSTLFFAVLWLTKSLILGLAIKHFNVTKSDPWEVLSGIIVALFLLQTRTPTYSLIFWTIPLLFYVKSSKSAIYKFIFVVLVLIRANFLGVFFENTTVILQFIPLIISIFLGLLFIQDFISFDIYKELAIAAIILSPILIESFAKPDSSRYVLPNKGQFITYDFEIKPSKIVAYSLGKQGSEQVEVRINAKLVDTLSCRIIDNEIFYKNKKIDLPSSMKKKAVLVNQKDIYFLTDYRSRVGWLNLKKVSIRQ